MVRCHGRNHDSSGVHVLLGDDMATLRNFACVAIIFLVPCETVLTQAPIVQGTVEVQPFDNVSGQQDDNWIGIGVANALATDFAFAQGPTRWLVCSLIFSACRIN